MKGTNFVETNVEVEQVNLIETPQRGFQIMQDQTSSIVHPPIEVNNFELKPNFIQIIYIGAIWLSAILITCKFSYSVTENTIF